MQSSVIPFLEQVQHRRRRGISLPLQCPGIWQGARVHSREQHGCSGRCQALGGAFETWAGIRVRDRKLWVLLEPSALVPASLDPPRSSCSCGPRGMCSPTYCTVKWKLSSCSSAQTILECCIPQPCFISEALVNDSFIPLFCLSFPSPSPPLLHPSFPSSQAHFCRQTSHVCNSPLSISLLQFLRKGARSLYDILKNQILHSNSSGGLPPGKYLKKKCISLIGLRGDVPLQPQKSLEERGRGLHGLLLLSKRPFSEKNKERNQPIPSRCHHLFLVVFRGRSGWVSMATDASSAQ